MAAATEVADVAAMATRTWPRTASAGSSGLAGPAARAAGGVVGGVSERRRAEAAFGSGQGKAGIRCGGGYGDKGRGGRGGGGGGGGSGGGGDTTTLAAAGIMRGCGYGRGGRSGGSCGDDGRGGGGGGGGRGSSRLQRMRAISCGGGAFTPEIKGSQLLISDRQTISFIEISIEAGILLGGKHKACFVLGVAEIEPMPS
jgi:hypothetical protein